MTPKTYRIDLTKKEWLLNIFILFAFFYGIFAKNIFAFLFSLGMFTIINILSGIRLGIKNYYFSLSTRDIDWKKRLTAEELELIEDAKELVQKVDSGISFSDVRVHKIRFEKGSFFLNNPKAKTLNIYIQFDKLKKQCKDNCFFAIVHELLHAQNLKNHMCIFNTDFLEGLNQVLTIWLITNYSEKYKVITEGKKIFSINVGKLRISRKYTTPASVYSKEAVMVVEILDNAFVDIKEVFVNYINFNPDYFRSFVPYRYFKKN